MTSHRISVLVVDDEPAHVEAIRRALQAADPAVEVRSAGSLQEYRTAVADRLPDIAIVDLVLPDGRADEALASPAGLSPFPILMMTSHGDEQTAVAMLKAGALDYIVKSAEAFAETPHAVGRALREWRAQAARRRAEAELGEREEHFRSLVSGIDAIVFHVAVERGDLLRGRVTYMSPQVEAILGYSPDEFVRDPSLWSGILHPADRDTVFHETSALLGHAAPLVRLYRLRRKGSDDYRWIEDRLNALRDASGPVVALHGVAQDVTPRKRAEEALRESEERYQQLFEMESDAIFLIDNQTGRILEANRAACLLYGRRREELLSMRNTDLSAEPEETQRVTQGTPVVDNVVTIPLRWHRKKNGDAFPVEITGRFFQLAGRPVHVAAIRDVTERKRAETALRENEERFRVLIEHSHDAIALLAADGTVLYDSPSIERVLGYDPTERLGRSVFDFVHPDDRQGMARGFSAFARQPGAIGPSEVRFLHKDGTLRDIEGVRTNLLHEPAVRAVVVNYRDITERKRAQAERLELERRLLHAQKLESLGILAGGIAHDFNNLLMAVLGNLDLARRGLSPVSCAHTNIEQAIQATRRATDLTRQMLAYSGKGRFVVTRVDLSQLVRENAELFRTAIPRTTMLNVRRADHRALIEADPGQVQQVIMNLITNASEAVGEAAGIVTLTTDEMECDEAYLAKSRVDAQAPPGLYAYLEVSDTGCGMDAATQERLFDPFFTTKFAGRGLGMAAVLGIVRGHRGAILVESAPGRGTAIRVLFPACATAGAVATQPADVIPRPAGQRSSGLILVVDDEDMVRGLCVEFVESLGYGGLSAADGKEALALFEQHAGAVVLVLLDLTMPGLDGAALLRELRRRKPDVRVILSSGYGEEAAIQQLGKERPTAFIQKPFRLEHLQARIEEALQGSERGPDGASG